MGYFRKKQNRGVWGVVDNMNFPWLSKKWHVEFPGVNKKQREISKGDQ